MSRSADGNKAEKFAKKQNYFLPFTSISVSQNSDKFETQNGRGREAKQIN